MTDKQKRFADEYLIDCNATRAYKAAYPNVKKDSVARANGSRLLANANIKSYIEEKMAEMSSQKIADAREVLEYLTVVMRGGQTEEVLKLTSSGEQRIIDISVSVKERMKAAELLGKYYSLWADRMNIQTDAQITFVEDMTPDG